MPVPESGESLLDGGRKRVSEGGVREWLEDLRRTRRWSSGMLDGLEDGLEWSEGEPDVVIPIAGAALLRVGIGRALGLPDEDEATDAGRTREDGAKMGREAGGVPEEEVREGRRCWGDAAG